MTADMNLDHKKNPSGKKGRASSIDEYVGARLRQRRTLLGMSQEKLADAVGITFQQIQKYENGANRVSAGRLYEFSNILEVPVNFFYENMQSMNEKVGAMGMAESGQAGFETQEDLVNRKETIDLIRTYYQIENEEQRKDLLKMIKTMVKNMQTA
ncbi:MAG: helix-turn-helix transcriptional regulator [Pseudomonadota bacterium]